MATYIELAYPKLNQTFTNVANTQSKVYVADVYSAFVNDFNNKHDNSIIQNDGIHPSESGNQIIYNTLIQKINELESLGVLPNNNPPTEPTTVPTEPTTTPSITVEYIIGDSNGDGTINVTDVTAIQSHLSEISKLTGTNLLAADTNKNGSIDIKDATEIQKYLANVDTDTRIGEKDYYTEWLHNQNNHKIKSLI